MADFIHRTERVNGALRQVFSKNTPLYSLAIWIKNPDLSGVSGVAKIYWETSGDTVVEMSAGDKAVVDQAALDAKNATTEQTIKDRMSPPHPLDGYVYSVVASGLDLTVNIDTVVVDDVTSVVADGTLTKYAKVCYIYNSTSKSLSIEVFERTDGLYDGLAEDEATTADFGEWSVVANGTDLVEV